MSSFEFILVQDDTPFLGFNVCESAINDLKLTNSALISAFVSDFTATSFPDSFPLIRSNSKVEKLLVVNFISNPINSDLYFKLDLASQSLSLTYHPLSIAKITHFFMPDISDDEIYILQNYNEIDQAFSHLKQFQESTWKGDHKSVEINCIINAPVIIIPSQMQNESFIFDLGKIEFKSSVPSAFIDLNSKILSYLPNDVRLFYFLIIYYRSTPLVMIVFLYQ